jgi:hypothetical protein
MDSWQWKQVFKIVALLSGVTMAISKKHSDVTAVQYAENFARYLDER